MYTLSKNHALMAVFLCHINMRHNVNHVLLSYFMPTCYYNDHHWEPNTQDGRRS